MDRSENGRERTPIMARIDRINSLICETNIILDEIDSEIIGRPGDTRLDEQKIICLEDMVEAILERSETILKLSQEIKSRIFG